ncbi:MAG: 1-acyl-sn-glycerol-3-phosphate acyltransferase [Ruminiclostridium sp.]|nr:1-acyl-sn-glycerol-3-phosphate acyltransferase [Ruminiclostridium sp.]
MYLFLRFCLSVVFHIKYGIRVMNKGNIPDLKGGYIIACNHQSNLDPPMVAAVVKGKFSFIAKEELFHKHWFITFVIKHCGAFPVARGAGDDAPIKTSVECIEKGRILVIFPEGTRSKDGVIGRMRSGVVLIASKANAPVLPVCIRYIKHKNKKRVVVNFGELIPQEDIRIDEDDRKSMRNAAKRIGSAITELQKELYDATGDPVPAKPEKSGKTDTDSDE